MNVVSREQTLEFLKNHVKTEMLMKHLYTVEASEVTPASSEAMRSEGHRRPGSRLRLGDLPHPPKTTQSTGHRS